MGKITIKYYLNRRAKSEAVGKEKDVKGPAPLYVQVTVKRKVNRIKSQAWRFVESLEEDDFRFSESLLESVLVEQESSIGKAIAVERRVIENLINFLDPFNRELFTLSEFTTLYEIASAPLKFLISEFGNEILSREVNSGWSEVHKIINWENTFTDLYKGLSAIVFDSNSDFKSFVLDKEQIDFINVTLTIYDRFTAHSNEFEEKYLMISWFTKGLKSEFAVYLKAEAPGSEEQKSKVLQLLTSIIDYNRNLLYKLSSE